MTKIAAPFASSVRLAGRSMGTTAMVVVLRPKQADEAESILCGGPKAIVPTGRSLWFTSSVPDLWRRRVDDCARLSGHRLRCRRPLTARAQHGQAICLALHNQGSKYRRHPYSRHLTHERIS
jgi:hypothetical protein